MIGQCRATIAGVWNGRAGTVSLRPCCYTVLMGTVGSGVGVGLGWVGFLLARSDPIYRDTLE